MVAILCSVSSPSLVATLRQIDLGWAGDRTVAANGRQQVIEVPAAEDTRVADCQQAPPRTGERNIQTLLEPQKADRALLVGSHEAQHDDVFFAALERIYGIDLDLTLRRELMFGQEAAQHVALLRIGSDNADGQSSG